MRLTLKLIAAAALLAACASSYDGRGQEPQAVHPGDIVRQQQTTTG